MKLKGLNSESRKQLNMPKVFILKMEKLLLLNRY